VHQSLKRTLLAPKSATAIPTTVATGSGVFGQLQDALNIIWGVKSKPGKSLVSFLRARFLSFAMVAGVCFLLLVSLNGNDGVLIREL
jgi:membrane protein